MCFYESSLVKRVQMELPKIHEVYKGSCPNFASNIKQINFSFIPPKIRKPCGYLMISGGTEIN